jgi:hypothetical protein
MKSRAPAGRELSPDAHWENGPIVSISDRLAHRYGGAHDPRDPMPDAQLHVQRYGPR